MNSNPGLEESSPLVSSLIPRMLDDALRLTIDDVYDTKYNSTYNAEVDFVDKSLPYFSPYPVTGYNNSENLWSLVCSLFEKEEAFYATKTKFRKIKKTLM